MNDTPPPPHENEPRRLSNTECLAILTSSHLVAKLVGMENRALFRAVHALARRVMQKERNMRSRAERAGAFVTPPSVAEAVLANPPFEPDVTVDTIEPENNGETK